MEKITQLVHSLSNREVKLFYKYNALSGKKTNNLKIRLFEIAKQNSRISDMEAAKLLGKSNNAAFSMLKSRLQDDILKVLVFDGDESRFFAKVFRARYKVFKLLAETLILNHRNLNVQSYESILKADKLARQYELISSRIIINELLVTSHQANKGPSTYKRFKESIFQDLKIQEEISTGQDLLKQLIIPDLFSKNKSKTKLEIAKATSEQLKELSIANSTSRVRFLFLRSQMELAELSLNFVQYNSTALEFLELVSNNPSVRTSDNIGGAHLLLAESHLHLKNSEKALEHAERAESYFFKNSNNYYTLLSTKYYALLYAGRLNEAKTIVDQVRGLKTIKRSGFQYSKWVYFDANLKFLKHDFQGALSLIKRHSFLKTDRSGWRLGFKILELLCIVELEHFDWIQYRLDTLRKLLSDIEKVNINRPRLIHKILSRLLRDNFDFAETNKKMSTELDLLRDNSNEYYRYPNNYEVIPFESWWDEKLKSQKRRKSEG